jgi:hypothetical protein
MMAIEVGDIPAVKRYPPSPANNSSDTFDQGRLAGTIWTKYRHHFTTPKLHPNIV